MCGIFGSFSLAEFEMLYLKNRERGNFSYGALFTNKPTVSGYCTQAILHKYPGVVDLTGHYALSSEYDVYLGHTQAPTSSERNFHPDTSHPFESDAGEFIVAHNGVLENHIELLLEYDVIHTNPVDSSVIPILLECEYKIQCQIDDDQLPEVRAMEIVFSKLKGTFSCWIFYSLSGAAYIVRCGSVLYGRINTGNFSSVPVDGMVEQQEILDEGVIYCVTSEGLAECSTFKPHSPFFL